MKRMIMLALSAGLVLAGCGASGGKQITTVETREEAKELSDEFYAGLAEADPIMMTSYMNGEKTTIFTKDGEKMYSQDLVNNTAFYLFKENGKAYYMNEGEDPMKEDFAYDLYAESVNTALTMFVTGFLEGNGEGADQLAYKAVLTADGPTSELSTSITGESEGKTSTYTVTGTKTDGKVTSISVRQNDEPEMFRYEFAYDVSVDLPEYTIHDITQSYKHTDSPYETVEEVIAQLGENEDLNYTIYNDRLLVITQKDGRWLQLVAQFSEEDMAEVDALDVFADDYDTKKLEIVRRQTFNDCVDFTDALPAQEELDGFVGKTVGDVVNAGYEGNGWGISEEESHASFEKELMEYDAKITLPEGFDADAEFEFDDLSDAVIEEMHFTGPSMAALPME